MRLWSKVLLAGLAGTTLLLALGSDEEHGKDIFVRRCSGCHALDVNKEGPKLRGVYGREAARLADFGYSDALKKSSVRWDEATLDRWLADPDAIAPDTDMAFSLKDAQERKEIIAYLKTLKSR
jgi:cytochrome c